MVSKKKSVSISLPQALAKKLKDYQQKQSIESSEDAIVAALEAFFQPADDRNSYAPLDRLIALEAQVDRLSQQIEGLQKFAIPAVARLVSHPLSVELAQADADDDIEDEPDEILYEFLEREK